MAKRNDARWMKLHQSYTLGLGNARRSTQRGQVPKHRRDLRPVAQDREEAAKTPRSGAGGLFRRTRTGQTRRKLLTEQSKDRFPANFVCAVSCAQLHKGKI